MADLDDVRQALGYRDINLWGGSWGTRAALLYASTYPRHVRSVVLDGAVPLGMGFPDTASVDAQRALEMTLADCERDEACRSAFPHARREIVSLLARFDAGMLTTVRHPRSGIPTSVPLTRAALAEFVRVSLYSPITASRLPAIIREATNGDLSPLMAQWIEMASATTETMALGTTMSILCSEDLPVAPAHNATRATPIFGDGYADFWRSRCHHWPRGPGLAAHDDMPLTIPALILSGELDPVTPPRWGDAMARSFPRHAHLVVPGGAHNVSFTGCVPDLIAAFLESGRPEHLDASCATRIVRPPFVLSSAGSRP